MTASTDVFIFGDQTLDVVGSLQNLIRIKGDTALTTFLDAAVVQVKCEISKLPASERAVFPSVDTLGLLLDAVQRGRRHVALDSVFTCIYDIGLYLHVLSQNHEQHPLSSTYFLGICTGSIAAAALSCSNSTLDISRVGPQAVAVAFRVGMHVYQKAELLGHPEHGSWTTVVAGTSEQEAEDGIAEFLTHRVLVPGPRPYISSIGHSTVTISAPPGVLDELLSSSAFSGKKSSRIPISGPYHSSQLYPDINHLVASTLHEIELLDRTAQIPTLCCTRGSVLNGATFGSLLHDVISNVLTQKICMDQVVTRLLQIKVKRMVPINTQVTSSLATSLAIRGCEVLTERVPSLRHDGNGTQETETEAVDNSSKIAIVGFSGRFPEADGLDEFWDLLEQGLDVHKPIPPDRFDRHAHYDATGKRKNTSKVMHGCWIRQPGLFDHGFFHLSPREARQTDPAQRLALLTAFEALEMAGFVADRTATSLRHRVGVFYGTTSDDWREVNSGQNVDTYFIPGGNRAFIPGRINYFFKFSGPSISVDTACSSSLAAINIAITSLLKGECDTAVAGGTNIMTNPDNFAGLDRGHFLSPTGNCKPFDDSADGYCRADGVGTVILKRLSDALADNDPVFGVVLSAGTNHSAESISITRPLADAQEYLLQKVLSEAGVRPHEVDYIEMHGTGTQAGDAVEMRSVLNTFAWDYSRQKSLHLGSVKANVGHGESASGVTALIKLLLMMRKSQIPPHCGIKEEINRGFPTDLERRGVHIAMSPTAWTRPRNGLRRAVVNNFSAAGGNTALLVEDGPMPDHEAPAYPDTIPSQKFHLVAVSARSEKSLRQNLAALADFIGDSTSSKMLAQVSYTTTARRIHHNRRVTIVTDDFQDLKRRLLEKADAAAPVTRPRRSKVRVGFFFTGQGVQHTAHAFYSHVASFGADMVRFDAMAKAQGLPSVLPLVDGSLSMEELSPTVVQLGTCLTQIALARLWIRLGLEPQYVIGHSLGEYAALHIAGVISIGDIIWLCAQRAALLERRCTPDTHGMLAVKASRAKIEGILASSEHEHDVEVACINGPEDTVLSGRNSDLDETSKTLSGVGVRFTRLALPFAFHSSQVSPILSELETVARGVTFHKPKLPVISTLLAAGVIDGDVFGPSYIARHCRGAVDFSGAIESAAENGTMRPGDLGVEIGTHPVLGRKIKSSTILHVAEMPCHPSLRRDEDAFKTLLTSLGSLHEAGVAVNWDEYHRDVGTPKKVVSLPSYKWEYENHWIQYEPNWCLTKGDPITTQTPLEPPLPQSTRLSASVHHVVEQTTNEDHMTIITQSDLHDKELLPVCQDHLVKGVALCPSSLYADIAYTLASHLLDKHFQEKHGLIPDICNMVVDKAIVLNSSGPQLFRAAMTIDKRSQSGDMKIYTVDEMGNELASHVHCSISIQKPQVWQQEWKRISYLITRSKNQLCDSSITAPSTHRIGRGVAYKLFSSAVQYGPAYQAIEDVTFDSEGLEATARVRLQPTRGHFSLNPCWADSFGHLTGFVMNSNDSLDLSQNVYINHGWGYMRCSEPFSLDTVYNTYVKMQRLHADSDAVYSGDVYVLRGDEIVAVYGAVTFNKVPRRVLNMMLPSPSKSGASFSSGISTKNKPEEPALPPSSSQPKLSRSLPAAVSATRAQTRTPMSQKVLQLISDEIGVERRQLSDETLFTDVGVDSLMSLTILSNMRESLDLDVAASFFDDNPSVGAMKSYLNAQRQGEFSVSDDETSLPDEDGSVGTSTTSMTTPTLSIRPAGEGADSHDRIMSGLVAILAEEMGVSREKLLDSDDLAQDGLDSLLSLTVLSSAREKLEVDLPHDLFLRHTKISDISKIVREVLGPELEHEGFTVKQQHPPAASVTLQGGQHCKRCLFLFPDGSGSATSYAALPIISPDVCVIGLNCPYMKTPERLKCSLQDLMGPYVAEIRRRQPRGPYTLAGWSAGGIAAYDAAQRLVDEGEIVEQLILLDSPNPIGLEKLPARFYKFLEKAGVFGSAGGAEAPEWLIRHFLAFIDALDMYKPIPFRPSASSGVVPRTTIIWAKDGVLKNSGVPRPTPEPGDPKEMRWLLENRVESVLGYNGWDVLLGAENITIACLEEANHFSMVRGPRATALVAIIREALGY